jgi:hypothetical protein
MSSVTVHAAAVHSLRPSLVMRKYLLSFDGGFFLLCYKNYEVRNIIGWFVVGRKSHIRHFQTDGPLWQADNHFNYPGVGNLAYYTTIFLFLFFFFEGLFLISLSVSISLISC